MKIRSALLVLATSALATVPAVVGLASAAVTLTGTGAYTDNYKASYNADPTQPELRTWLALREVAANGVSYAPSALPAAGMSYVAAGTGMSLRGSDGGTAVLTANTSSTNVFNQGYFRTDSNGDFGLLQKEASRAALRTAPVREVLTSAAAGCPWPR